MCRERSISFSAIESREKSRFNINFLSSISSVSNLLLTSKAPIAIQNPCIPSPCGPYSQCRETNGHAICSCIENCIGSPPACRPECTLSSECFLDKACINQKCVNPCVAGTCGENARCQIINHNPICSCSLGYTGDPFIRCTPEESKLFWCSFFSPAISVAILCSLRSHSVDRWSFENYKSFEWEEYCCAKLLRLFRRIDFEVDVY